MKADGFIEVRQFASPLGVVERREYHWKGGPTIYVSGAFLYYGSEILKVGDSISLIKIGPYRLRLIDQNPSRDEYRYVREDYAFWWIVVGWHHFNRMLDLTYRRVIIVLSIFKLADLTQAQYPSWRDIHLVHKIRRWIQKCSPSRF